jgi:hypothetical protein
MCLECKKPEIGEKQYNIEVNTITGKLHIVLRESETRFVLIEKYQLMTDRFFK